METKPGDLLFLWGKSLIDEGIEIVTHGPSHCAMFLDENTVIEAQGGKAVGECPLSFYLQRTGRLEVWTDPSLTDQERKEMVDYALSLKGTGYDYLLDALEFARFEFSANIDWYQEHQVVICSTYINKIAQYVNKIWTHVLYPAPVDLTDGGILIYKEDLNGLRRITTTSSL